jgi:secreted PhoX family phosphatase
MRTRHVGKALAVGAVLALAAVGVAIAGSDFGAQVQTQLHARSKDLFGVGTPLEQSSTASISQEDALARPGHLITLAGGLRARVVTAGTAPAVLDQSALWPDDAHPQWLITCNESGTSDPGLVRINIASGDWATIVTGTNDCDPVRATPWGTILFGEEAGGGTSGGAMYELSDPIGTTGVTLDRTTGTFSGGTGAENLVARYALGRLSFEGLAMYSSGLTYYGDENRPSQGTAGGAYFKFVPTNALAHGATRIQSLDDSPLAEGSIYGLRLGLRSGATDYGQGTETGFGQWVQVCQDEACNDIDLRAQAAALRLTGYYRPEDADVDPAAQAAGDVRFCGNNTGNESDDQNWGETVCITDGTESDAMANSATPEVQRLVEGSPALAMPDNIDFQPGHGGNVVLHEDADTGYLTPHNNDLWDCLPDGSDDNLQTDGCIRIGTLNDLTAEWTGGIFDASGKHFYVSVQHNISGFGTIFDITGWR